MALKVLIVDDSEIVLFLHREILMESKLPGKILSAIDGKSALEILLNDTDPESNYLILLDINMPIMDGWEFLEALPSKNIIPRYSVIMVTSSIDTQDKRKAAKFEKVIGFFEKPLTSKDCIDIREFDYLKRLMG